MKEQKQSYYEWLCCNDIVDMCKELLQKGGWTFRLEDNKLYGEGIPSPDTPWVHLKHSHWLDCTTWHRVMFDVIGKKLGQQFVPSGCMNCYKVVVRPKTVRQLFALEALQRKLNKPSKCGIEIRQSVHGLYGGYFYNEGLAAGKECYKVVRQAVNDDPELGPNVGVLLKRACTEYEHALGDSRKWEITDYQLMIEDLVNQKIVRSDSSRQQPEEIQINVKRRWIEWAYANGDGTYQDFTNGKPLYPPYATYHED